MDEVRRARVDRVMGRRVQKCPSYVAMFATCSLLDWALGGLSSSPRYVQFLRELGTWVVAFYHPFLRLDGVILGVVIRAEVNLVGSVDEWLEQNEE